MVGQIINSGNGVNRTTNTLASSRNVAHAENQIINENNGSNDSTNIIHNEADTIYATNQIINVYDYPEPSCNFPSGPGPWSPAPPCCSPWACYNPWACCIPVCCGFFPFFMAMAAFPYFMF